MATMNSQTESHHALWQESRQGSRDLKKSDDGIAGHHPMQPGHSCVPTW
jgi:hypothetical protein